MMKKYDLYGGLFWLFIAIFVSAMGVRFGLGTFSYPGPGFFPFLVGLILLCFAVGILFLALRERDKGSAFHEWPYLSKNALFTLAILLAYSFSLEYLGYIIASFILMLYLFKVPGGRKWRFSIFVAVVMIALTYYFFGVLLQAQFPKGVLNIG